MNSYIGTQIRPSNSCSDVEILQDLQSRSTGEVRESCRGLKGIAMRTLALASLALLILASPAALGQTAPAKIPPPQAMKLSELIVQVEKRDKFQHVDEIQWSDQGYYDVTYFTSDKAKVEIKLDPTSGEPK